MKLLILGSKEYPMGTNVGDDPQPSGGIEIYIDALVPHLTREADIRIITRKFRGTKNYEKNGNIEVYRVPWLKGFYLRNISFNFFGFLKALKLDFDILFTNDLFATLFGIVLTKIKKKPLLAVNHGTVSVQPQYNPFLRRILGTLEKFAYSNADHVVSLAENVRDNFREYFGYLPEKWKVIPMGLNFNEIEKASGEGIIEEFHLKDKIVVAFVGRLLEVKGCRYLIESLRGIDQDFALLIVGSGPEEKELKNLVKEKGLEDKVVFTGFREDVLDILAATDIYVLPSISEGLSISLLEAKASGCASIVTDIGLPVEDGKTALVVPPGDPDTLRNALERLLRNKGLREELSRNSKEDAKKYSWEKAVEEYSKIFNELARK
jgi:glycosyltransferase involved in cell wall biosynthesis